MENLGTSLWITLIGMGLVFAAIILLWGLMALLVNLTKDKVEAQETVADTTVTDNGAQKAMAAAAAVAVALAANAGSPYQGEHQPPNAQVNAWQSAKRNLAQ